MMKEFEWNLHEAYEIINRSPAIAFLWRKKYEETLLQSKRHWGKTLDAIPALITLQDTDMRIIRTNKAVVDFLKPTIRKLLVSIAISSFGRVINPVLIARPLTPCPMDAALPGLLSINFGTNFFRSPRRLCMANTVK